MGERVGLPCLLDECVRVEVNSLVFLVGGTDQQRAIGADPGQTGETQFNGVARRAPPIGARIRPDLP